MLSDEEKKEMLEDARSIARRDDFRMTRNVFDQPISLDEYISYLEGIQKVFGPFPISHKPTVATNNRL